jgi:acyl carrier protein
MVRIESAFNLEIPGAVVAEFNTAGDVIAFIEGAQCA